VVPQAEHRNVSEGSRVTLGCALTELEDVLQVTWQKESEESRSNLATYSKINGARIQEPYRDRMNFTSLLLNHTSVTLWNPRLDDSGCYICLFNTFPSGSVSGRTCLSVFGLKASVRYNISGDHLVAVCDAVGLPEPSITWSNLFKSTPMQETVRHANGVVAITSTLEVHSARNIRDQDLSCRVSNSNEDMELPVWMEGEEGSSLPWLAITAGIVTATMALVLLVLCCRKRIRRR
ncbi:OX2G protein, partial [Upupa epops]|nr:OX2G protein [Upupa epops]